MKKYADFITLLVSFVTIVFFSCAAISKMHDFETFIHQLSQFAWLRPVAEIVAWIVPNLELTVTVLLMIERTRKAGLYSSFGLLFLFTAFLGGVMIWADELPCACGPAFEQLSLDGHLMVNISWLFLVFAAIVLYPKNISPKEPDAPTGHQPNKEKKNTKVFIAIDQE